VRRPSVPSALFSGIRCLRCRREIDDGFHATFNVEFEQFPRSSCRLVRGLRCISHAPTLSAEIPLD
jgi:hypothetical protein